MNANNAISTGQARDDELREVALRCALYPGTPYAKVLEAAEAFYIFLTKQAVSQEEDAE